MKNASLRSRLPARLIAATMVATTTAFSLTASAKDSNMEQLVEHGSATNKDVRIHCAVAGPCDFAIPAARQPGLDIWPAPPQNERTTFNK